MVSSTFSLRRTIALAAIVTVCGLSPFSQAAPVKASNAVEEALKKTYGQMKTEVLDSRQVNGVTVHDVRITSAEGSTSAIITDSGEYLIEGYPEATRNLPREVAQTMDGLFGGQPSGVQAFTVNEYFVELSAGGQKYGVTIDPVGRPIDIDNHRAMQAQSGARNPHAGKDVEAKLAPLIKKRFPGAKIQNVSQAEFPGYYFVYFAQNNEEAWIILNEQDRVRAWAENLPKDKWPKEVQTSVAELFKGARIEKISRSVQHIWEFEEKAGQDTLKIEVHTDGQIKQITSENRLRHLAAMKTQKK